jgi:AcrR family transcriptional regulator
MRINEMAPRAALAAPLYRRLPFGPSGMAREDVARNQRARLCAAMIESVSERGYERTAVAHVIALAGVSRRSFYELFAGKEHCFLATHDAILARERRRVIDAWQRERAWASRLHGACDVLLGDLATQPKAFQLLLVDSLDAGAGARERMQLSGLVFERLLAGAFGAAPDRARHSPHARRAIVAGVREAVRKRMLAGREHELPALTAEILAWIACHRLPGARLGALRSASASAPAPATPAFLQGGDDRTLALGALVSLTLEQGYAALSDARIARVAGTSTGCFHRHFIDKQACFLAVLDELGREALCRARGPFESASSWPQAVERAICELLQYLLAHRALLRLAFVNVFEVGASAAGRLTRPVDGVAELLTSAAPGGVRGSAFSREALAGAIWASIGAHLGSRSSSNLPRLAGELTFMVLAPQIGAEAAVEQIQAVRRPTPAA